MDISNRCYMSGQSQRFTDFGHLPLKSVRAHSCPTVIMTVLEFSCTLCMFSVERPTFQFRFTYRISQALFNFSASSFEARRFTWAFCIFLMTPLKSLSFCRSFSWCRLVSIHFQRCRSPPWCRDLLRDFFWWQNRGHVSPGITEFLVRWLVENNSKVWRNKWCVLSLCLFQFSGSCPAFSHRQDYRQTKDSIKDGSCFKIQTNGESDCEPECSLANNTKSQQQLSQCALHCKLKILQYYKENRENQNNLHDALSASALETAGREISLSEINYLINMTWNQQQGL